MGQGQDKIARSLLDIEPSAVLEFFLLYYNYADDQNSFFAFHGGSVWQQPVKWQGIEYLPLPVETEGFETNANGRIARPKIKISNKDYIISDFLKIYKDLQFARLIRKRTFLKFIDDDNFQGGNPWGESDANAELSNDTYIVSQKTSENKIFVEFELSSPLDMENININNRLILSRYCGFTYRGDGCFYNKIPVADSDNKLLTPNATQKTAFNNGDPSFNFEWQNGKSYVIGDIAYVENKNIIIDYYKAAVYEDGKEYNYLKSFYVVTKNHVASFENAPFSQNSQANWKKDECSKTINGCKLRFGTNSWLPFGGFPSTENFSYGQR